MNRKGILIYKIRLIRGLVKRIQNLKTSRRYKYEFKEIDILAEKLIDLEATILESKIAVLAEEKHTTDL